MDIGTIRETWIVEPLFSPVPEQAPSTPQPAPAPEREPVPA
jgi:hypothetical protein